MPKFRRPPQAIARFAEPNIGLVARNLLLTCNRLAGTVKPSKRYSEGEIMSARSPSPSGPDAILEAAIRVANRDGLLSLTLEHVAAEAGVSKGGLLYHFPSKAELVRRMVAHFGAKADALLADMVAADPEPRGRWVRAIFAACGTPDAPPEGELGEMNKFFVTLFTASAFDPELLAPISAAGRQIRDRIIADEDDPSETFLIWLALDGLFVWERFGLTSAGDPTRKIVFEAIRHRVEAASRPKTRKKEPR